jgi:RNA recognition motif-containing protein
MKLDSPRGGAGGDRGRSTERHNSQERDRNRSSRDHDRSSYDKRDKDPENYTQVYVAKLHRNTTETDLKEAFSKYGKIKEVVLKRAYAFIDYDDHEAASLAVKEMDRKTFVNGEELVVE